MSIRKILLATSFLVASAIPTMADSPYGVCPTTQSGIDTLVKTADNISFSRIEAAGFTLHTTQVGQEPAYEALLRKVSAEQDAFVKGCLAASTLTKTEIDPSSLISVEVRTVDLMQRHCGPSYLYDFISHTTWYTVTVGLNSDAKCNTPAIRHSPLCPHFASRPRGSSQCDLRSMEQWPDRRSD
jgi:hypothetical protein